MIAVELIDPRCVRGREEIVLLGGRPASIAAPLVSHDDCRCRSPRGLAGPRAGRRAAKRRGWSAERPVTQRFSPSAGLHIHLGTLARLPSVDREIDTEVLYLNTGAFSRRLGGPHPPPLFILAMEILLFSFDLPGAIMRGTVVRVMGDE